MPVFAAMLATSIGTNTLNPQLALNPSPMATAVIISFSISSKHFPKDKPDSRN
jgi:hypothetical protein